MLLEILTNTCEELFLTDPGTKLLKHGATLCVGDAIKVHAHGIKVGDIRHDGVCGGELVLAIGPALFHDSKGCPGFMPFGCLCSGQGGGILCEAFVEPQVIPPAHSDKVTKPHVGKLVQDGHYATLTDGVSYFGAENVSLGESDTSRIFHGTGVEFGYEKLVVFVEGVGVVEFAFKVGKTLAGFFENVIGIHVFR